MTITLQDRARGSLVAGAAGDALGYPVEFIYSYSGIQATYGTGGICRHVIDPSCHQAVVSDDTQMTLFTACGLLNAGRLGLDPLEAISGAYLEWYATQTTGIRRDMPHECNIAVMPQLNVRRAPGNTCLSALANRSRGLAPENNSKGCGGVMRVAPIPLWAMAHRMPVEQSDRLAGEAARLTHLHPLGYLPAAIMAHMIYRMAEGTGPASRETMLDIVAEAVETVRGIYTGCDRAHNVQQSLLERAAELSANDRADHENITTLGGGWVGEEALAIAVYCALRYLDDPAQALVAAVNHGGDSDSTGSIAGNIVGASLGINAMPAHLVQPLELRPTIIALADQLVERPS